MQVFCASALHRAVVPCDSTALLLNASDGQIINPPSIIPMNVASFGFRGKICIPTKFNKKSEWASRFRFGLCWQ